MTGRQATQETLETSVHGVLEIELLTEHAYRLRAERNGLQFIAGQCANVGFPGAGVNREYSLYSGESDPFLDFLIKEVEGGLVSVQLKTLKPDDRVEIHGAYGQFCLRRPHDRELKYLLIGTGAGIAPFHSFVRSHPNLDYKILHGIRYPNECYGRSAYAPERYVACVSRSKNGAGGGGDYHGRVTDYLRENPVKNNPICYLCGNRRMIEEAYELLRAQGVPADNLIAEVFF